MKRYCVVALLLLMVAVSCSDNGKVKKPKVFLEEEQMINVLADSYLIEAKLNQMKSEGTDITGLQQAYYDQLFDHYGITDSIFEQNMYYYTHHPDLLERVMDSVNNRFAKVQR